jgi:hypothetical protein
VAWLTAVVLLAAALTGAIIVAVHYHREAAALHRQLRTARASAPPSAVSPMLSSTATELPAFGPLVGEVTVFAAARSSARLAQIIVTARISGGRPHSSYELIGGDCAGNAADHSWASGVTDARGSADLTGHVWRVAMGHEYYLILSSSRLYRNRPGPAVHGYFGTARGLSAVRGGTAPCAS